MLASRCIYSFMLIQVFNEVYSFRAPYYPRYVCMACIDRCNKDCFDIMHIFFNMMGSKMKESVNDKRCEAEQ